VNNYTLASFTVAEFKAFKKALRTLVAAGVSYQTAVDLLVDARATRTRRAYEVA
jgi:hypothetical protein